MYGQAIDFVITDVAIKEILSNVIRSGAWNYPIPEDSWVHVQINPGSTRTLVVNDK